MKVDGTEPSWRRVIATHVGNLQRGVYFGRRSSDGCVKIGHSGMMAERLICLTSQQRFDFEIYHLVRATEHGKAEMWFHDLFHYLRVEGEWFNLPEDLLTWVKTVTDWSPEAEFPDAPRDHCYTHLHPGRTAYDASRDWMLRGPDQTPPRLDRKAVARSIVPAEQCLILPHWIFRTWLSLVGAEAMGVYVCYCYFAERGGFHVSDEEDWESFEGVLGIPEHVLKKIDEHLERCGFIAIEGGAIRCLTPTRNIMPNRVLADWFADSPQAIRDRQDCLEAQLPQEEPAAI